MATELTNCGGPTGNGLSSPVQLNSGRFDTRPLPLWVTNSHSPCLCTFLCSAQAA